MTWTSLWQHVLVTTKIGYTDIPCRIYSSNIPIMSITMTHEAYCISQHDTVDHTPTSFICIHCDLPPHPLGGASVSGVSIVV